MLLRALFPLAFFAGIWLWADARRSGRLPRVLAGWLGRLLLFAASTLAMTWWVFASLEQFPLVFLGVGCLWVWIRSRAGWDFASPWMPVLLGAALVLVAWGVSGQLDALAGAFVLLAAAIVAFPSPFRRGEAAAVLDAWWLSPVLGLLATVPILWVWGSLNAVPAIHDEAAYLLQARLFANGRWTAPSPPLPAFFEQFHVLLVPAVASKYPPGHSLLLAAGALAGCPGLVPLLLTAGTGALLHALARGLAGGRVALLAWIIWAAAPGNLEWRPTYFSEVTTGALWLVGWWALWRWKERGRTADLLLLAASIGWSAITRPLTALAFALPATAVVLMTARRRRAWRDLLLAGALGGALLALIPLWSAETTGSWRVTPLLLYTRQYMPYDVPGFGHGLSRPERPLPRQLDLLNRRFEATRNRHSFRALPQIARARLEGIGGKLFGDRRWFLLVFALAGALALPAEGLFALGTSALLVFAYLFYWHRASWGVYYLEIYPVVCCVAALGIVRVLDALAPRLARPRAKRPWRAADVGAVGVAAMAIVLLVSALADVREARAFRQKSIAPKEAFLAAVNALPERRVLVFVRYSPQHDGDRSFVANDGDFARARVWLAHDRGAENLELIESAPDRTPYLYDEAVGRLVRLPRAAPI